MKKLMKFPLTFAGMISIIVLIGSGCKEGSVKDDIPSNSYKKDQLIIIFKKQPTDSVKRYIKTMMASRIDTNTIMINSCHCEEFIQLWEAENIHTVINGESVLKGTEKSTKSVGEDPILYSLNYISKLPFDDSPPIDINSDIATEFPLTVPKDKLANITIAVLDTGVDTSLFNHSRDLFWTKHTDSCVQRSVRGWNFINDTDSIQDNHTGLHGTKVNLFILNEFINSKNNVKIMNLKTHDENGIGNLFQIICGLHFAMDNQANIINASWGFYHDKDNVCPYFDSLINIDLKRNHILFVTAAGNRIEEEDSSFQTNYPMHSNELRNLDIHKFYPACYSTDINNVVTVTTVKKNLVSGTQNHSNQFVDLGVEADTILKQYMKFKLPFTTNIPFFESGSSMATAIATGKIGATLPLPLSQLTKLNTFLIMEPKPIERNTYLKEGVKYGRFITKSYYP